MYGTYEPIKIWVKIKDFDLMTYVHALCPITLFSTGEQPAKAYSNIVLKFCSFPE